MLLPHCQDLITAVQEPWWAGERPACEPQLAGQPMTSTHSARLVRLIRPTALAAAATGARQLQRPLSLRIDAGRVAAIFNLQFMPNDICIRSEHMPTGYLYSSTREF